MRLGLLKNILDRILDENIKQMPKLYRIYQLVTWYLVVLMLIKVHINQKTGNEMNDMNKKVLFSPSASLLELQLQR